MATINSYSINDFYWHPVDFKINGDQIKIKRYPIIFDNGISFNYFNCFEDLKDHKVNNDSFIFLTDLNTNTSIFEDNNAPKNNSIYQSIVSPISSSVDGYVFKINSYDVLQKNGNSFNFTDSLSFSFSGTKVSIKNTNNLYLTYINGVTSNAVFKQQIIPYSDNQFFDYFLGNDTIVLFKNNSSYSEVLKESTNGILAFLPFTYSLSGSIFGFVSYDKKQTNNDILKDSFLALYEADPLLNQKKLKTANKDYSLKQNYLGIFPIENYNLENNNAIYYIDINGLKNYQTTEYQYNKNQINREYNKIFTGTNQSKGYDKIHLGYQTSAVMVEFQPSLYTKFYFTPTKTDTAIGDAGFIEDGATAATHPLISDRIYTTSKNKLNEIQNSNFLNQRREYLCSWLYGDKSGIKRWYDRYYNSAYYTVDQALSSSHLVYNEKYEKDLPLVFDVHSTLKLQPAVEYEYYRAGKYDSKEFIKNFNYKYDNGIKTTNVLSITHWTSGVLTDDSVYKNNGISYFTDPNTFKGSYWELDGKNYAVFPAKANLLEKDNLTVSLWLNADNWSNVDGYQIFGNYYESGFGLINDSKTFCPFITFIDNLSGTIYNFNYRFGLTSSKKEVKFLNSVYTFVQRMADFTYWVFDSVNYTASKYTADDKFILSLSLRINEISQVETDSNENIYIFDKTLKRYEIISNSGLFLDQKDTDFKTNRIEIDLNDNLIEVIGNASVIDNNNVLWEAIGQNIYYSSDPNDRSKKNIYGVFGNVNQITCDNYNNIWVLFDDVKYCKIDTNQNLVFTKQFNKSNIAIQANCPPAPAIRVPTTFDIIEELPFLSTTKYKYILDNKYEDILVTYPIDIYKYPKNKIYKRVRRINFINSAFSTTSKTCNNIKDEDQMIMIDHYDNTAYIINQFGEPVIDINLNGLVGKNEKVSFTTEGDFTGYQNVRKFKKQNNNISWKFKVLNEDTMQQTNVSLPYNVSSLPVGWHNFVFVFNSTNGTVSYYIDSKLVNQYRLPRTKHSISYIYESSLLLGAASVQYNILNNILNIYDGYMFKGKISELKMYNIALSNGDVEQLYMSSDLTSNINSLKWNMQIGTRNYIEQIKHWFKFQLPTSKSKYYNINLHNLKVDDNIKQNIEIAIKNIITKISPAYTDLYKINWK